MTLRKLNFAAYVTTMVLICCHSSCLGQEISLEKVKEFIPKSAIPSETRLYTGDLNRDEIEDALLLVNVSN